LKKTLRSELQLELREGEKKRGQNVWGGGGRCGSEPDLPKVLNIGGGWVFWGCHGWVGIREQTHLGKPKGSMSRKTNLIFEGQKPVRGPP